MKNRNCCVCKSSEYTLYKKVEQESNNYRLLQCNGCGLVYLDGTSIKRERDFIKNAKLDCEKKDKEKVEYWSFPNLFEKHKPIFIKFFDERLKRIKEKKKNIETMLDVGSGYGFWMDYCEKREIVTEGFDLSDEVVDYAKNRLGLNVSKIDAMKFEPGKKYDLIMMFDILEHMEDPNGFLSKYRQFLSEDGLLYLQVPNLIGFHIPREHGYGLPEHLWQFSFETLSKLLKNNGYNVEGHWTGPMGVIGVYEQGKNILWNELKWKISSKLHLGTRLQVIAKNGK